MSDLIKLKFNNWSKYQPRKDHKHPRWLAISNELPIDRKFVQLSEQEKLIFLYLLCETSKQAKHGICEVMPDLLSRLWNANKKTIVQTIEKLTELSISTYQVLGKYSESTLHNNTERDRTEQYRTKQHREVLETNSAYADSLLEIYDPLIEDWLKNLKPEIIKSWQATYQDLSWVKQEILKAKTWCVANPSKAPKSNFARFITNWLARGFESYRKTIPSQPMSKAEVRDQHNINAALEAAEILRQRNEQRRKSNQ